MGEKLGENLTKNQKDIFELISKNSIPKILGLSSTSIENNIAKLKKKGILKRKGPAKGGQWEINDQES